MLTALSAADRAIGRLDSATELLPNPDLFIRMFVRREAVDSSRIEGAQASLTDLLEYEADRRIQRIPKDSKEVSNYVTAMNHGLASLAHTLLSNRLLREIHQKLMAGVRGGHKNPGQFRTSQNWIGHEGGTMSDAMFVPPPQDELPRLMGELELFLHDQRPMPPLIKCGLVHSHFETIHPFLDGNGRMGRLLITFILCWQGVLSKPLLYLSQYFKHRRQEYYDRLQAVRDRGDWEGWMLFFLEGVREVSLRAMEVARNIQAMRDEHRALVAGRGELVPTLLDHLLDQPFLNVKMAQEFLGSSYQGANNAIRRLEKLGILREFTSQGRNRFFLYQPYLDLFKD